MSKENKRQRLSKIKDGTPVDGMVELLDTTATIVLTRRNKPIYLKNITVSNASDTDVLVAILDGSTERWKAYVASAGGGAVLNLSPGLLGTDDTPWKAQVLTEGFTAETPAGIHVSLAGTY